MSDLLNRDAEQMDDTVTNGAAFVARIQAEARKQALEEAANIADWAFGECDEDIAGIGARIGRAIRAAVAQPEEAG